VGTFASAEQFASFAIEVRAPLNQFGNADGTLGDECFGGGAIHDSIAGAYCVQEMEGNVLIAVHGDGDSALCVVGVGFAERLLGDDQNFTVAGQFNGGSEAGNTRAHDQKINLRGPWHLF
jgi:hypothetical protein